MVSYGLDVGTCSLGKGSTTREEGEGKGEAGMGKGINGQFQKLTDVGKEHALLHY